MKIDPSNSYHKNRIRVRVCGFHMTSDSILLLKHMGIGKAGFIWSPPGGGIEEGENARSALIREFKEETNLDIEIERFLFSNEYIDSQHHAMELFFEVRVIGGKLKLGADPECKNQILTEAKYLKYSEIDKVDNSNKHNAFHFCSYAAKINNLNGYYLFENF
jgi:8-oxo-dGTP diphosphatase